MSPEEHIVRLLARGGAVFKITDEVTSIIRINSSTRSAFMSGNDERHLLFRLGQQVGVAVPLSFARSFSVARE